MWVVCLVTAKSANKGSSITQFGLVIWRSQSSGWETSCGASRERERMMCSSWFAQQLRKHMTKMNGIQTWLVQGHGTLHTNLQTNVFQGACVHRNRFTLVLTVLSLNIMKLVTGSEDVRTALFTSLYLLNILSFFQLVKNDIQEESALESHHPRRFWVSLNLTYFSLTCQNQQCRNSSARSAQKIV